VRPATVSRNMPLALLVALTACQSPLSTGVPSASFPADSASTPGSGTAAAHLYVAIFTASRRLEIERFRLHKGIPARDPDLVYQGYGGLLALSGDGTLYSTVGQSPNVVDAFSPDNVTPVREIDVTPRCGPSSFTVISAIAADPSGYLFVLIYSYPGLARSRALRDAPSPDSRTPCNGVAIYGPNASGKAQPVQAIHFSTAAQLNGLAVDASDNLYVSGNYPSEVEEFSNAVVDPTRTRTFSGKYIGDIRSVATDSAADLFIANAEQSYSSGWINRYAPNAKGRGAPANTIYLQGSGQHLHLLYSIAVQGRYLYADDTTQSVDLYYARKNGEQTPIDSLTASKVDSVAVGP
jgi:hypothetical protein